MNAHDCCLSCEGAVKTSIRSRFRAARGSRGLEAGLLWVRKVARNRTSDKDVVPPESLEIDVL